MPSVASVRNWERTEMDDFENTLAEGLGQLVDGEAPSTELRDRVESGIRTGAPARSFPLRAVAAAAVVLALVGVSLASLGGGGGQELDVASDRSNGTEERVADDEPPATTVPVVEDAPTTTVDEPEVMGEQVEASEVTPPPTTVPQLVCQNSTDPACGAFSWSPAPVNQPATLTASVDGPVYAGSLFRVNFTMSDPDGAVEFDCVLVEHDGPGVSLGSCEPSGPGECPARYGPWTPPAPTAGQATSSASIQIDEPGTYTITVRASSYRACANVDPYRSDATTTLQVTVVAPPGY